jgi:predicted transcriptional regulator
MKDKLTTEKTEAVTIRLNKESAARLRRIIEVSKRSKTSVILECLQGFLPELERQYKKLAA